MGLLRARAGALALGNAQPAISDFNAALRLKPDSINVLVLRGRANNLAKSYDAAIADLTDAIVHPKSRRCFRRSAP